MNERGKVRIGTSGWVYRDWRNVFYSARLPVGDWLTFYASHFETVEINNTFYGMPSVATVTAWERKASPGFLFAVKANRILTHRKRLKDVEDLLKVMLELSRRLANHLGPLLYQLPPYWRCDVSRLRHFIDLLPRDLLHVFEFRDPSWCNEDVRALLTSTGMSYCIHDMPGFAWPEWVTARTVYIRFHGPGEQRYSGRCSSAQLRTWADRIDRYRKEGHDVFVYFNNDVGGHALTNARELREELDRTGGSHANDARSIAGVGR